MHFKPTTPLSILYSSPNYRAIELFLVHMNVDAASILREETANGDF